jgi:steroid delta-isomerase-like uncharacterized protein
MQTARTMTVDDTRAVMEAYAASHDVSYLAEDAIYTDTATGQQHQGREAIGAMLRYVYQEAFDARAELHELVVGEGCAAVSGEIVGTHTGEFAGVPATGASVRIPLAVVYRLADDEITEATIYLQLVRFLQQVGAI